MFPTLECRKCLHINENSKILLQFVYERLRLFTIYMGKLVGRRVVQKVTKN